MTNINNPGLQGLLVEEKCLSFSREKEIPTWLQSPSYLGSVSSAKTGVRKGLCGCAQLLYMPEQARGVGGSLKQIRQHDPSFFTRSNTIIPADATLGI